MRITRCAALTGGLLFLLLGVTLTAGPAGAQGEGPPPPSFPPGFLSDVTGPFIGNMPALPPTATLPPELQAIGVHGPVPIWMALSDPGLGGTMVQDVISFNAGMDKLLPFGGCCTNINWKGYNNAVKAANRLRQSLSRAVAEQQKILASNPSPQQIEVVQKRLRAIEDTTTALERATQILVFLATSLDKAR